MIARIALLLAAWLAMAGAAEAAPTRFTVLPGRSEVSYTSGTQLGEFQGRTDQVAGEVVFDPQDPVSTRVSIVADVRTLKSDNAARDRHMYEKLLEVDRFPSVSFTAAEFRPAPGAGTSGGEGTLLGTLQLHGVERPVSVPVRFALDGTALQGEGTLVVKLTDFAMTPPRLLGLKVRDSVTVQIRLFGASR